MVINKKWFAWKVEGCLAVIKINDISGVSEQDDGAFYVYLKGDGIQCYTVPYSYGVELLKAIGVDAETLKDELD